MADFSLNISFKIKKMIMIEKSANTGVAKA